MSHTCTNLASIVSYSSPIRIGTKDNPLLFPFLCFASNYSVYLSPVLLLALFLSTTFFVHLFLLVWGPAITQLYV